MQKSTLTNSKDDRIFAYTTWIRLADKMVKVHYYTRAIAEKTELYLFGCGLGDMAIFEQVADSFFEYVEKFGDPQLGRVVISAGVCRTAFTPYRGDVNCYWAWGGSQKNDDWLSHYLNNTSVKPEVFLCASKTVLKQVEESNLQGVYLPAGVGSIFKPLGLKREGFGYAGLDSKTLEQKQIVLEPAMSLKGFEWISRQQGDKFLTLTELNKWYNSKKIVFGMATQQNLNLNLMSNRVFESLASGTPFINYRHQAIEETLGFPYPYQTSTRDETEVLLVQILENYENVLEEFSYYSRRVLREHHYVNRLKTLFDYLKELKC